MLADLSLGLILLGIAVAGLGLYFEQRMFTFISGFLFIFIGITSGEIFLLVTMIGLGLWQFFSTFFEWSRG